VGELVGQSPIYKTFMSLLCGDGGLARKVCLKAIGKILNNPPIVKKLLFSVSKFLNANEIE